MASWLGLVPAQHSSGGKTQMQGISKRGDSYLRSLLVHGARSVIWSSQRRRDALAAAQSGQPGPTMPEHHAWLAGLLARRHANVATVALAAKNARMVWAVLKHGRNYEAGYVDPRFASAPV